MTAKIETPEENTEDTGTDEERADRVRAAIRDELAEDEFQDNKNKGEVQTELARQEQSVTPIIELKDVSLAFDRPILEDVSFVANEGETIVVVGESGTGKSTILKLILRLLTPDSGEVFVQGEKLSTLTYEEALQKRQCMGMVFQGGALFDSLTVFDNIAYPLREHTDLAEDEIEKRVREKLEYVDLDPEVVMPLSPSELSGGMQKRVGIARGLVAAPQIMLYDEPTSGLDPLTTGTVTNLILKLQRNLNVTSIVVTHDIRSAFRMASKIALLAEGHIVFFGAPEEMTASDDEYIQKFLGGF